MWYNSSHLFKLGQRHQELDTVLDLFEVVEARSCVDSFNYFEYVLGITENREVDVAA